MFKKERLDIKSKLIINKITRLKIISFIKKTTEK